jgi:hypothetical protein
MRKKDPVTVPASFFGKVALPFGVPILLTFALLLAGDRWPRDIAPGSGLKLAGLIMTSVVALIAWRLSVNGTLDARIRKAAALLCLITGLMGWPVWTAGVLPSINGSVLGSEKVVRMKLQRTEVTHYTKGRQDHHWAWLTPEDDDAVIGSGRYRLSESLHDRWNKAPPVTVLVTVARGALGAQVVKGFE